MVNPVKHWLLISLLLLLAACAPLPVMTPTLAPPTATPPPAATATPTPLPSPALPTLFDTAWADRSPFAAGLIAEEQGALEQRPGASVYHIDITLADSLTQLQGRQEVLYTNRAGKALTELHFRLFPNLSGGRTLVSNITLDGRSVIPRLALAESDLILPLTAPLPPGGQITAAMDFTVDIPTTPGGNYGVFALLDEILALAHFYPMLAVFDDEAGWQVEIAPHWGDVVFAESSYYLVRVNAPADQALVASGVRVAEDVAGDRQIVTFAAGPMRDFYLVSSAAYEKLSATVGETTLNAYAPPAYAAENALALEFAAASFRSYSDRFGAYPFTELDVVGTPTLAGGVEYPGIVVVALAIYNSRMPFFEAATTHEVAHQWFYSVVGNDQIDEPWLDEALTQYATMLYYGDAHGRPGYDGFRASLQARWRQADDKKIPIGLPVAAYEDASYGAIVYGRGPLFFEALAAEMGEDVFAAFLPAYYQTFKYDIVSAAAFKTFAEAYCACDLTALFTEWVFPRTKR